MPSNYFYCDDRTFEILTMERKRNGFSTRSWISKVLCNAHRNTENTQPMLYKNFNKRLTMWKIKNIKYIRIILASFSSNNRRTQTCWAPWTMFIDTEHALRVQEIANFAFGLSHFSAFPFQLSICFVVNDNSSEQTPNNWAKRNWMR